MVIGVCKFCKKEKQVAEDGTSEGVCKVCYKRFIWKRKNIICRRCNRQKPMQAKGLCAGCYASIFSIEVIKASNHKKRFDLDYETYKQLTKSCTFCGFDKIVELHHLDHNRKNNDRTNLVSLCPNHHRMLHNRKYQPEIFEELTKKGFLVPKTYEKDEKFKS